jgi:hypothetical protein
LKEWHDIEERYKQATADKQHLIPDCERLRREVREHHFWYDLYLTPIHSNMDLAQMSTHQLEILKQALVEDQQAGKATWALYETQKKLVDVCNVFEGLLGFLADHFVLAEGDEQNIQEGVVSLAATRRYIRELGPQMTKLRKQNLWEEEDT